MPVARSQLSDVSWLIVLEKLIISALYLFSPPPGFPTRHG